MPMAYRASVWRRGGSSRAARSQRKTSPTRITAYPRVTMAKLAPENARGTPAARISTPTIWTKTPTRYKTSSLS